MDEPLVLNDQQVKTIEAFANAVGRCQAVSFVAIIKEGDAPAVYRTGGYKTAGPTVADMAKALGVVCAEMAQMVVNAQRSQGKEVDRDEVIQFIFDAVADGADHDGAASGTMNIREAEAPKDRPPLKGPEAAPRGF